MEIKDTMSPKVYPVREKSICPVCKEVVREYEPARGGTATVEYKKSREIFRMHNDCYWKWVKEGENET